MLLAMALLKSKITINILDTIIYAELTNMDVPVAPHWDTVPYHIRSVASNPCWIQLATAMYYDAPFSYRRWFLA